MNWTSNCHVGLEKKKFFYLSRKRLLLAVRSAPEAVDAGLRTMILKWSI